MRELERGTVRVAFAGNEFFKVVGGTEAAFAGTHDNADVLRILVGHLKACILQCAHARNRLELSQIVELAVKCHLDAQFLVVIERDLRANRGRFGFLARIDGIEVGGLAVAERRHDAKTRHGNFLVAGGLCRNAPLLLGEDNACVGAAKGNIVAHDALERLTAGLVLHKVHLAHLFLERLGIFFAVGEGREHRIGRQRLDAEHRLDCTCGSQAMAGKHLGRAHAHGRVFFTKEALEGSHFGIVVLAGTGTVGIHIANVGLLDAGILDGTVHGLDQAKGIFAGGRNVVSITCNAGTEHLAVLFSATLLGVLVRFHDDNAGAFAKCNAVAVVERGAAIFVEGMQRKESGIGNRRKGIGAARHDHVGLAGTDQVARQGDRDGACRTGVRHVGDNAAGTTSFRHLGCNGCDGHLGDVGGFLGALMIMFNRNDSANATSDNDTHALVVVEVTETCIGQSFVCSLDAKFGDAVLFFWGVDFIQGIAIDFGSQVRIAVHSIDRSCLMDTGNRFQGIFPSFFNIVTDGTNNAQTGNYTAVVIRGHNYSKKLQDSTSDCFGRASQ